MSLNLALDFQIAAEKFRNHPAILYNGLEITYGELANSVRYWTILLSRMGVSRGDNVCMVMPNVPEFTIAYFAILHLGAVVVPCNTLLTSHELAYQISHSDSRYILAYHNCMLQCVQAAREVDSCGGVIVTCGRETGLKTLPVEYHEDKIYWVEDEIAHLKESFPFSMETVNVVAKHENTLDWRNEADFEQTPWPAGSPQENLSCPSIPSTIPIGPRTQEYVTGVLLGNPSRLARFSSEELSAEFASDGNSAPGSSEGGSSGDRESEIGSTGSGSAGAKSLPGENSADAGISGNGKTDFTQASGIIAVPTLGKSVFAELAKRASGRSARHRFAKNVSGDSSWDLNEASAVWESIPTPDGKAQSSWSPAPVPTNPDDPAVILYTSGTTGFPKGAQLTHFNLYSNAQFVREYMTGYQPGKRTLAILPFYHSFGQTVVQNAALFSGATIVMVPRFDPRRVLQTISELKVDVIAAVPTMLIHLARMQQKLGLEVEHIKQIISGGSTLTIASFEEVQRAFPGSALLEGYGLSETSPLATAMTPTYPPHPGSIGREISGTQVRIMRPDHSFAEPGEVGEIVIRGHNVMKGYHKNQLATESSFVHSWFLTGDLGYCNEEGYFYLVDRKKDIIIRAGMNIYPREIEEVLNAHPEVLYVSVVGIPHPVHGEDVIAFVTLKTENSVDSAELAKYCRSRLATYKCPQRVVILAEMPKGPTGKILKRELRKMLEKNEN